MAVRPDLADATDLVRWADRRDSQSGLPRLIRRLILASGAVMKQVSFRADEGVQLPGWDGITSTDAAQPHVPEGVAGWELSTRKDVRSKADDDYAGRVADPDPLDAAQTTFVFATARRWAAKGEWAAERSAEGKWRAVVALDADDLETWLETAPAVHLWFSTEVGKHPDDAVDLDTFWRDWSEVTRPATSAQLLLAGRKPAVDEIHRYLRDAIESFAVKAESPEEALAVFAAAVYELQEDERERYLARTIVVRTRAALDHLAATGASLVLIPLFDDATAIARAVRRKHRVVVPAGVDQAATPTTVVVPRLGAEEAEKVLAADGVATDVARELATLARRSLMALRRKLAHRPEVQQPTWAHPENARSILPFLLVGGWNEASAADLEIVGRLAQASVEEVQARAAQWSRHADPPIRNIANVWYVASKEDAWRQLAPALSRLDLERFEQVVYDVLGATDPRLNMPTDERWKSVQRPPHSSTLRQGLAETLAVMGSMGSAARIGGRTVDSWAEQIVRRLLERANADWRIWASLSHHLPLLAEAAPAEFLAATEQGIADAQPVIRLFEEHGNPLFSSSPHTGLLWALERLAWSPEHLSRTALILAKLTRLDPGGTISNRPRRSLRETFLPWHPQTLVPWDRQSSILAMLLAREPDIGWQLLADLLPRSHDSCASRATPAWRDWAPNEPIRITFGEHARRVRDIATQMLATAGNDGRRWTDLVASLSNVPPDVHELIVQGLEKLDADMLSADSRGAIWNALRSVVAHHRSFPDAHWAMPKGRVDALESLYQRFEPTNAVARYGWLFANHVQLPDGREDDWQAQERAVADARREAVEVIHCNEGTVGIEDLIPKVQTPSFLGAAFGATALDDEEEDELLRRHLAAADMRSREFARGFVFGRGEVRGPAWLERKFALNGLSAAQRAVILMCLPNNSLAWELAHSDAAVETEYWKGAHAYIRGSAADVEYVARKLIDHGRAYSAAELLAFRLNDTPPPGDVLIADTLEAVLRQPHADGRSGNFAYHLGELLDSLANSTTVDEARVARIEWGFAPLLSLDRPPATLHRELARDPAFFAELIAILYRPEQGDAPDSSKADQHRASAAFHVLDSWRSLPGQDQDGTVDESVLAAWVATALEQTAGSDRPTVGAQHVGKVLSHGPDGADGAWPHEAVRGVLEHVENAEIETGFEIGRYNQRGVVSRSLDEGGRQERALADEYARWAAQVVGRWPRTAAILRRLEATYRRQAESEDAETDLRHDGLW